MDNRFFFHTEVDLNWIDCTQELNCWIESDEERNGNYIEFLFSETKRTHTENLLHTHISFYFCNMLLSRIISFSKVAVDQTNNRIKNERISFCWWKTPKKKVSNFVQIYNHYFGSNWMIMIAANKKEAEILETNKT